MGKTEAAWRAGHASMPAISAAIAMAILTAAPVTAEPRLCMFTAGDDDLDTLPSRCQAGDVVLGVVDERAGSPLGYAARMCDFTRQIVTYRHPDPDRSQNVFACVFTGHVLALVEP